MRPRMREIEGERGLRIAPAFGFDAAAASAERAAAVGADREPRGHPSAIARATPRHRASPMSTALGLGGDQRAARECRGRGFPAPRANAGSRCCSRRPAARSRRHRSRPPARAAAAPCRRPAACAASGAAWSAQRSQTPSVSSAVTELASSAVVRLSCAAAGMATNSGLDAGAGERDRRGQSRWTAADHHHFGYSTIHDSSGADLTTTFGHQHPLRIAASRTGWQRSPTCRRRSPPARLPCTFSPPPARRWASLALLAAFERRWTLMFWLPGRRAVRRRHRRHVRAQISRRRGAAALVRRRARSGGRFRHLRVRAGLCDRGQRAACRHALAIPAALLIVVTSALYFADRDMKTADNYFRGFPALWNAVAFYLFVLKPTPWLAVAAIIVLAVLTFVPFKFLHPFRVTRLRIGDARGAGALGRAGSGGALLRSRSRPLDRRRTCRHRRSILSPSASPTNG